MGIFDRLGQKKPEDLPSIMVDEGLLAEAKTHDRIVITFTIVRKKPLGLAEDGTIILARGSEEKRFVFENFSYPHQFSAILNFGRGHDCQVRLEEMSVSRLHGTFFIQFDRTSHKFTFTYHDASTFGTWVKQSGSRQWNLLQRGKGTPIEQGAVFGIGNMGSDDPDTPAFEVTFHYTIG